MNEENNFSKSKNKSNEFYTIYLEYQTWLSNLKFEVTKLDMRLEI